MIKKETAVYDAACYAGGIIDGCLEMTFGDGSLSIIPSSPLSVP
ncbi:hypothetical protein AR1Y2_1525 [Anaerostipes rhamnosivorans]|uniref:Uncharacterized protein n=1 Tax=Anaerostipes rhamnosivorans TaxID=1229621 RepID=A0A4P8III7_9FIRM|nr:hypothetical protein AR1Y2_1525 [Anaerostipes rhamnosivorans]